jgi:NADH-quinone oxidoreductase subunit M
MTLIWLILVPVLGGVVAWLAEWRPGGASPRWIALAALMVDLILAFTAVGGRNGDAALGAAVGLNAAWLAQIDWEWIPQLGARLHLGMDGLSLLLVLLTIVLGVVAVIASWSEITERLGFFHFNLLLTLAGVIGVFLALDLLLFFFFWELMLVPMYFIIAVWGHERRVYAAIKFFLFTQGGGLLMLAAILALFFIALQQHGVPTFDYFVLSQLRIDRGTQMWIMLGFFVAFAVKLPAVPFHTWLPDAHSEAPTAGSVILASLLLKTGAYGLLRFAVPLFPAAAAVFAPVAMTLGVIGILYGALLSFAQCDIKRLIAYTSVSHLGFVLLGIYAWDALTLRGALMQMLAHGFSTGGLFVLAGALQERLHTRNMSHMGGLWSSAPRLSGIGMVFAVASLGLPGLGNFVGEFLVLAGVFEAFPVFAVAGALGLVASAIYALAFIQRVFHGSRQGNTDPVDLGARHVGVLAAMIVILIWLGLQPQPVFDAAGPALGNLQRAVSERQMQRN